MRTNSCAHQDSDGRRMCYLSCLASEVGSRSRRTGTRGGGRNRVDQGDRGYLTWMHADTRWGLEDGVWALEAGDWRLARGIGGRAEAPRRLPSLRQDSLSFNLAERAPGATGLSPRRSFPRDATGANSHQGSPLARPPFPDHPALGYAWSLESGARRLDAARRCYRRGAGIERAITPRI